MPKYLALRLYAPFQSWGITSQFNFRHTGEFPTKSAVYGMICAAFGYDRGSQEEAKLLEVINEFPMTSFKMILGNGMSIYEDFHIVRDTFSANGKPKNEVTNREYLMDVSFGVILYGDNASIQKIWDALHNPIFMPYLGRKCCMPLHPFTIGVFSTEKEAIKGIVDAEPNLVKSNRWYELEKYPYQKEVLIFAEGNDTLQDVPISFGERTFASRRVLTRKPAHF